MRRWVVFVLFLSVLACRDNSETVLKPAVWAKKKSVSEKQETNLTLHWSTLKEERTE